ncbi:hypothetical protein KSS87_016879 [Heliosperma pusillum]|nr:hypothetical protein KSS87_016879 [Heliosperma pusillum]
MPFYGNLVEQLHCNRRLSPRGRGTQYVLMREGAEKADILETYTCGRSKFLLIAEFLPPKTWWWLCRVEYTTPPWSCRVKDKTPPWSCRVEDKRLYSAYRTSKLSIVLYYNAVTTTTFTSTSTLPSPECHR